jgi:putative nucleotidyltransferase with HDIG domain
MPAAEIREFAQHACERAGNILTLSFFDQHLLVVAQCAASLAEPLGADVEAVELAAYLHDISAVFDPTTLPNHPGLSAELAIQILLERGHPQDRVGEIARAIALHSDPLPIGSASPEAVCISNADAVARIVRPAYWMYFAFRIRNCGFEEGRQWLRSLMERQWHSLIEPAKELVGAQYAATLHFLSG